MPEIENLSTTDTELSAAERSVLRALLYFDLFQYPLNLNEIKAFSSEIEVIEIRDIMESLIERNIVFKLNDFYLLSNDKNRVVQRLKGNDAAEKLLKKAKGWSKFISRFPFVRGVCISGSLSKGYSDELGDIDYFIITEPGRLWIARTLLIAFKKIFLLNSKKYFCVNYFIDTEHLEIPDKNIFTATETRTLLPMYNRDLYQQFMMANQWSVEFLPNLVTRSARDANPSKKYPIKSLIEWVLNGRLGDSFDERFMKLTMNNWQRKFQHFTPEYFEHALRSRKYVSKHHPQNFQKRVLESLETRIKEFESKHGLSLDLANG